MRWRDAWFIIIVWAQTCELYVLCAISTFSFLFSTFSSFSSFYFLFSIFLIFCFLHFSKWIICLYLLFTAFYKPINIQILYCTHSTSLFCTILTCNGFSLEWEIPFCLIILFTWIKASSFSPHFSLSLCYYRETSSDP